MIMAMQHGRLPASLHIDAPSPHIDWSSGAVELLTDAVDWPETGRPRRVGVSSFGASGTNAHLVLEQAPAETEFAPVPHDAGELVPWVLSARDPQALRDQATALGGWPASGAGASVADVGRSLATTRAAFEQRAVLLGRDRTDFAAALGALASGSPHAGLVVTAPGGAVAAGRTVWLFSGQGSQRTGMGAELH
ncbi:ketoacyl-synthetase C-terminal extension domain-containing protein, partial [Streptomyces sp. NRRL F-5123]|uniref:ketoacyl-synthetase C-terminal extension domain-containing protein n=1 Tax=Streptomyces sp. NRRL F-5123 TaxID=1463856 RepID=UPI002D21CC7D